MRDRPTRGFSRTNLMWVVGFAAGIVAGGVVAYSLSSSGPALVAATR